MDVMVFMVSFHGSICQMWLNIGHKQMILYSDGKTYAHTHKYYCLLIIAFNWVFWMISSPIGAFFLIKLHCKGRKWKRKKINNFRWAKFDSFISNEKLFFFSISINQFCFISISISLHLWRWFYVKYTKKINWYYIIQQKSILYL